MQGKLIQNSSGITHICRCKW